MQRKINRAIIITGGNGDEKRYEMRRVTGGLSLGSLIALILSIMDNVAQHNHDLTIIGQILWVIFNTICSWFSVIYYVVVHLMYN
jgi:hypothetical protein